MKRAWQNCGTILFWLAWPVIWAVLRFGGRRAKVIIVAEGKVLMVRGWLGNGAWGLPGGGLHRGEDPQRGAIREVREETSLLLKPNQLTLLEEATATSHGLRARYIYFKAVLPKTAPVRKQRLEITDIAWFDVSDLQHRRIETEARRVLQAWLQR